MTPGIPARNRPIPHATDTTRPADSVRAAAPLIAAHRVAPQRRYRRAVTASPRRRAAVAPRCGPTAVLLPFAEELSLPLSLPLPFPLSPSPSPPLPPPLSPSHIRGLRRIGWVQELLAFVFALRATQASRWSWSAQCLCTCAGTCGLLRGTVPDGVRSLLTSRDTEHDNESSASSRRVTHSNHSRRAKAHRAVSARLVGAGVCEESSGSSRVGRLDRRAAPAIRGTRAVAARSSNLGVKESLPPSLLPATSTKLRPTGSSLAPATQHAGSRSSRVPVSPLPSVSGFAHPPHIGRTALLLQALLA